MLLELAIGDAYGAGFEYANEMGAYNDLSKYLQHPRHRLIPGSYTDDTQMSIAIAEVIVAQLPWTPEVLADSFVRAFKRDPREGYASRFYDFLVEIQDGEEFLDRIRPDSDKSGAAMRAAPIGIYPTPEKVIEATTIQAAITHNTPDGINAAVAAALMSHYFIYRLGPKRKLGQFLEGYVSGDWSQPWEGKVKSKGWMSVSAAITAVMRNDSMSQLLQDCIAFTGDVDTVAAIALAAGSCSEEISQDIPDHLITGLENGSYGRDYLIQLDKQLMDMI
ncbi:ADP-ribosylglycohydrolase family protein [Nostoc sp. CENA67]|uniref:ADP-ribosylglycohydrolase family protein n=1 Tax=Amazonocrinis nigriterrae CENA67 TaxID=2794033 RepID=A0A8J7LBB8_9NOST|nr:ADP-ribosylglycohydrolase family protein [Amazonocrinis nigriterrae]MBH8563511.1 ADP-ribosylglycohydrolase family protein [Amazonocrinis nigriterrae CENA67]